MGRGGCAKPRNVSSPANPDTPTARTAWHNAITHNKASASRSNMGTCWGTKKHRERNVATETNYATPTSTR